MTGLPDSLLERMREKARAAKEKIKGGGTGTPRINLTGKNADVQAGQSLILRLGPRWDFAERFKTEGGKTVLNPDYVIQEIFVEAKEHWWKDASGKWHHAWCPKMVDPKADCPLDEAAEELLASGVKADRELGKDLTFNDVYLFNAIKGKFGARAMTEEGKPDWRMLAAGSVIFAQIVDLITGGDGEGDFSRGDVADWKEGYDLKLDRPGKDSGERWKVVCSAKPSLLYAQEDKETWRGWFTLLHNLPTIIDKEMKGYDDLYKEFHGIAPEEKPKPAATTRGAPARGAAGRQAAPAAAATEGDEWDVPPTTAAGGSAAVEEAGDGTPPDELDIPFDLPDAAPRGKAAPGRAGGKR